MNTSYGDMRKQYELMSVDELLLLLLATIDKLDEREVHGE
jgi:hypothetical protein